MKASMEIRCDVATSEAIQKDILNDLKDAGVCDFSVRRIRKCDFCEREIREGDKFETIGEKDKCEECKAKETKS